ncbi:hypothetical protein MKW98_001622 [Papaver atlanticum]|uniref:Uncharacterized protein n=1 Tax=Papaver atlanticum TaxID=357466 RepID=A0AAD4SAK2_9MAGN|nr:hypothetical protein MKW98_001622 [Papaver atlanticum]
MVNQASSCDLKELVAKLTPELPSAVEILTIAVKTTGNVFCYEATKELNIKTKIWKELLTDEPFTSNDLITIQNPNALDRGAYKVQQVVLLFP